MSSKCLCCVCKFISGTIKRMCKTHVKACSGLRFTNISQLQCWNTAHPETRWPVQPPAASLFCLLTFASCSASSEIWAKSMLVYCCQKPHLLHWMVGKAGLATPCRIRAITLPARVQPCWEVAQFEDAVYTCKSLANAAVYVCPSSMHSRTNAAALSRKMLCGRTSFSYIYKSLCKWYVAPALYN